MHISLPEQLLIKEPYSGGIDLLYYIEQVYVQVIVSLWVSLVACTQVSRSVKQTFVSSDVLYLQQLTKWRSLNEATQVQSANLFRTLEN